MNSRSTSKVLIIIPAYNESENIVKAVSSVVEAGYDYIVVNDGSTDDTLKICIEHNFNVINLRQNLGIGGAVQTGHMYAQKHDYDIDIQFDGDGQHDILYAANLIEVIEGGKDLAIGSRYLKKTDGFQSTFLRRLGKSWLSVLIRLLFKVEVTDPTSGFRACGKRAIDLFANNYPIDYPEPESIVSAVKRGLSVEEVSVRMNERIGGESSIKALSSIYFMIKVSLAIFILRCFKGDK